jgi:hypothetical protein
MAEALDRLRQRTLQLTGVQLDATHVACAERTLQIVEVLLDALQHGFELAL